MNCPAPAYPDPDELLLNLNDPAGTMGTATHTCLEDHINNTSKDLSHYVNMYGIPDKSVIDLKIMTAIGRIFWREFRGEFPNAETEPELIIEHEGHTYTGHIDVLSKAYVDGTEVFDAHILDWKTTRLEWKNYSPQMLRYLWQVMMKHPEARLFKYTIAFLRDKTVETSIDFTRKDLEEFHQGFVDRVLQWDHTTYCPGGECGYCPRLLNCAAHAGYIRHMMQIVYNDQVDADIASQDPAMAVQLYEDIRAAEAAMASAINSIKLKCEAAGDRLSGTGGKDLIMRSQAQESIEYVSAKETFNDMFTEDETDEFLNVNKTALLNIISDKAGRGLKKKAKDAVMNRLRTEGAINVKQYKVPAMVKHIPDVTEKEMTDE